MILNIDNASVTTTPRKLFGVNSDSRNSVEIHAPSSNTSNLLIVHLKANSNSPGTLTPQTSSEELAPGSVLVAPWNKYDDVWIQSVTGTQNVYAIEAVQANIPELSILTSSLSATSTGSLGTVTAVPGTGVFKTNDSTSYGSFSIPSSSQTITSTPIVLVTNGGNPLGSSRLGVLVANTGSYDAWVSVSSGTYMWLVPGGSYNYIPITSAVTLYILCSNTTTVTATEFGY